jgi:LacI family transcriptional regulator
MGKSSVTIYQIAEHVGISPAAVSSVFSNRYVERRLAPATVEKIRAAALTLGYVPNMAGRRLRSRRTASRQYDLAILTSFEAPLPLVSQALRQLQKAVDNKVGDDTRYSVVIDMFHAGRLKEKPGLLETDRYHGVIISNTLPKDDAFLLSTKIPYPSVILGRRLSGYCCVLETPDFVGRRAAEVLLDVGCKRPAVLYGRQLTQATSGRVDAFVRTIKERLGKDPSKIVSEGLHATQASAVLEQFLERGGRCDGLFTVTDSLAVGAYQSVKRKGMSVALDMAIVGVGDYELAEFFDPPLTTVAGANEAMVAEAVPLLFRLLKGEPDLPREVLVVPPVFLRDSTENKKR